MVRGLQRSYGDYLYQKGAFDEAVAEYIKTIGTIEPSYVIRRFLDAHQLPNLTQYLEAIHVQGVANKDHTTLLLKCYARMRRDAKLRAFVHGDKEMQFDVPTAIHVLRECNCVEEAKELALRNRLHISYVDILLNDTKEFEAAVRYLYRLSFTDADAIVQADGRLLLENAGDSVTELIISLCMGFTPVVDASDAEEATSSLRANVRRNIDGKAAMDSSQMAAAAPALLATLGERVLEPVFGNPSSYIYLFASRQDLLLRFLAKVVSREKECDASTWNTLLEMLLRREKESVGDGVGVLSTQKGDSGEQKGDSGEQKGDSVNQKGESSTQKNTNSTPNNTNSSPSLSHEATDLTVMKVLEDPQARYDKEEALVLVQTYNHTDGIVYLYQKNGLFSLLLQHYLQHNDCKAAIELCKAHGSDQSSLWVQLIVILAQQEPVNVSLLQQTLDYVEKSQVLPLLYVLQLLSQNEHVQVGMVRKYILHLLQRQRGLIHSVAFNL